MAVFSNQATLTYNGISVDSNVAFGEIIEVLAVTKTAIEDSFVQGDVITYVVTLRNTGSSEFTGLTVTDDLGGYEFGDETLYPLTYRAGSAVLFVDGVPQPAPTVAAGPPFTITGISVPAEGDVVLVYQAVVNDFADPTADGSIVNTVTVTGDGINTPVTATETVEGEAASRVTVTKSISPSQVVDNERVTYTFIIRNFGSEAVVATDDAVITDDFDPILTDLAVTFNGAPWTEGEQYNYSEATGLFATVPSLITVPAATYTQDPVTGRYTVIPGTAILIVVGTI